ncbi:unnamed protein product, partial [Allacma fusca]
NLTVKVKLRSTINMRFKFQLGDGDWNGLIGEVSKSKADIGFANVFLLDGREKVTKTM